MITIKKERIANIPVLHIVKESLSNEPLPLVIFIHGFTSAKEHNLHHAYLLAEEGIRVLLPDALYHGERDTGKNKTELSFEFWDTVVNTIHELDILKAFFEQKNLIDGGKIGVAGTSMGGIVTLGALTLYDWIYTGVSLMGSPSYVKFANNLVSEFKKGGVKLPFSDEELESKIDDLSKYDLTLQPEKLNGRPLMFWHGMKDSVVPYEPTYHFYESIQESYSNRVDDLKFISDSQAGHKVTREALLETVRWFSMHLKRN